ncbi:MAG TPA: GPW/gp25 family protein [Vicinamibacterales bacterium]|jgi:Phage baseplate assembly protein W|nr:GPW/gp25 family protein [Vicinamibacterales bacterium]
MADRDDYAFPFRIDPASRQAQRAPYDAHVAQMVRQVLLTTPGERADLPEFGCGLRALVFAGNSDALSAATQMLVQQSLARWLSDYITVRTVEVTPVDAEILVRIEYMLVATRASQSVEVRVI